MFFWHQQAYRHVPYETNVLHGGNPPERRSVATNGCGLCCSCMMVELLTDKTLSLDEAIQLSYDSVANHRPGTDMDRLGPAVAEKFNLNYRQSDSLEEVKETLRNGGKVIIRVKAGLFTKGSHYMLLLSYDGEDFCFVCPSHPHKHALERRIGKINEEYAPFLYYNAELMHEEAEDRFTKYHLFTRKK